MILEPEGRKLFFSNWLGLLAYVNKKYKLVKNFGQPDTPVGIKQETIIKIKSELWKPFCCHLRELLFMTAYFNQTTLVLAPI